MSKLTELHELIHSMGKGEKRSFRLLTQKRSQSQPVLLFDCLVKNPEWKEDVVVAQLTSLGLKAQLPTHIIRLRKQILQSLVMQSGEISAEGRLNSILTEIELLYRKRLLNQIPYRIRKAKVLAHKFSCFAEALKLIEWERRMLLVRQPKEILKAQHDLVKMEKEALEGFRLLRAIADLQYNMRSLSREVMRPDSQTDKDRFEEIRQNSVLDQALAAADFLTRSYAQHCLGLYHLALGNGKEAMETYTTLMERWKSDQAWINAHPELFLASFQNFITSFQDHGDLDSLSAYSGFFAQHSFTDPLLQLRFSQIRFMSGLVMLLNTGRFEAGLPLCAETEKWLSEQGEDLPESTWLVFQYNLAIFHFFAGNASRANRRIQAILNLKEGTQRRDLRDFALIFQLILYRELESEDLVEYRLRSVSRYFSQIESPPPPVWEAIKAYFTPKKESDQVRLQTLAKALNSIHGTAMGLVELRLWVQGRLSGRKRSDLFRELLRG